jgi:hypothetical protein
VIARLAFAVFMLASQAAAQVPETAFVPVARAVELLADGRPWSAVAAEGRRAQIVLQKDGTGTFAGPMTLSIAWRVEGETLCLAIPVAGTRCLRFREIAGGVQGFRDSRPDLALTR